MVDDKLNYKLIIYERPELGPDLTESILQCFGGVALEELTNAPSTGINGGAWMKYDVSREVRGFVMIEINWDKIVMSDPKKGPVRAIIEYRCDYDGTRGAFSFPEVMIFGLTNPDGLVRLIAENGERITKA